VIIDIQKAFGETVKKEFSNLTYSTSIIIAHYKTPLNKILYYSRKTLEETKNRFKNPPKAFDLLKNSIAITYITKSNNLSTSYFYKDRVDTFILLHKLLQDKESPKLSSKFIFNMAQEFRGFDLDKESMSIDEIDLIIDMMNVELKRLLKRASADFDRDKNEKKEQLQKLYSGLSEFIYDNWIEETQKFDFENYMMFFKVAEAMNGER
jgi:CRISPR-associated protein Cmr2